MQVMRLLYPVEAWFIASSESGGSVSPIEEVIAQLEPKSFYFKVSETQGSCTGGGFEQWGVSGVLILDNYCCLDRSWCIPLCLA